MSHHTTATNSEYVAILDAGSQFGKVIDRKVRELHVETIILPLDTPTAQLRDDVRLKAVIISGGPSSVYGDDAPRYHADLFTELNKPILGICYGMQLMVRDLGGSIERKSVREDGQDVVAVDTDSILFRGMDANQHVLLTHGDSVSSVGDDFKIIATSSSGIVAAVQSKSRPICGVQFHPEVDLTVHGQSMFRNFLESAGCQFGFTMADREATAIELIRQRTSDGQQVLCLVSGGVDSTVCAALLLKAIGPERLICIHIDHGFMRLNESSAVVEALSAIGVLVHRIDAAEDFANATTSVPAKGSKPAYVTRPLKASVSPEDKRHIIGNTFMTVCDKVTASMKLSVDNLLLAQGTLRPDLIESGSHLASNKADAIKTHHNDTELVRALRSRGKIIEPLSEYHKDEVRELGRNLGLPDALVMRQPFPGPGLAIRTLCTEEPALGATYDATRAVLSRLEDPASNTDEQASHVLRQASGSMSKLNLFATVLPIRTVGVQGDGRTYSNAVMLTTRRDSPDATVPWTQDEWVELLQLARLIPQVAHHANRVVFGFGPGLPISPTTITPTTLTLDVIDRIRIADDIVGQHLIRHNLVKKLSQVPVVLIPLGFEKGDTAHSVVIRTFLTNDFMTGIPATPGTENMPLDVLGAIVRDLQALPFVGRVLFDLTAKPPGTTEWE